MEMFMFEFDEGCFWIVTLGAKSAYLRHVEYAECPR
jgi:hypothetical protein